MAKNNEVRNLILEKAYNLFLLNNFEKVTISKLEKSCKKIRGTIFYYFSNKQELFEAVVDEVFFPSLSLPNEVSEIAVSSSLQSFIKIYINPEDRIIHNIKFRYNIKNANMSCYNFLTQACQYYNNFQEKYREIIIKDTTAWNYAIRKAQDSNEISRDIKAVDLSALFIFMSSGVAFHNCFHTESATDQTILSIKLYNLLKEK